ncbi:hypothetical protein Hdeb2414_s0007g00251821 [Helianthus debilis subsp. tardiflorus]
MLSFGFDLGFHHQIVLLHICKLCAKEIQGSKRICLHELIFFRCNKHVQILMIMCTFLVLCPYNIWMYVNCFH